MRLSILLIILSLTACTKTDNNKTPNLQKNIMGTWQLLSETKIEGKDTTYTPTGSDNKMIKIINQTHFAFLNHDLKQGKDSLAVFVAGGGYYNLQGDTYKEHLEYCNYREWENNDFDFKVVIRNDTLIQQGVEKVEGIGVDRIIIEKYIRVSK